MEDISNIIKEAKPLYFARKRRNNFIKGSLAVLFCVVMMNIFTMSSYTVYYSDDFLNELSDVTEGSVIADMGLPTDDYGLLMVV